MKAEILNIETAQKLANLEKENERLNYIIKQLEEWLKENAESLHNIAGENFTTVGQYIYQEVLDKIKELKEKEK